MSDLGDLYQELILDHSKRPRNRREIEGADRAADGYNPLCGDRVRVYAKLDGDRLTDVAFTGVGCAICTASASLMTDAAKGHSTAECSEMFDRFHRMVTEGSDASIEELGKIAVLAGVHDYPMRVKCATLPWHTLRAALKNEPESVSTED